MTRHAVLYTRYITLWQNKLEPRWATQLTRPSSFKWHECNDSHLFPSKYVLIEVILDLFVRDVYAQLLKRVLLKILKAEYVKNSDSEALGATNKEKQVNGI